MQRRAFIASAGFTTIATVAGCVGSSEEPAEDSHSDDQNNSDEPDVDFATSEEYGVEMIGDRECVHRSHGSIDPDGSIKVRDGTTVILEGSAEVPNPGYDIVIDDVSYESDSETLIITTDYEDAGAWNPDDDRYDDCPGVAHFKAVGELVGKQPESIRLDIRDVNTVHVTDKLIFDS